MVKALLIASRAESLYLHIFDYSAEVRKSHPSRGGGGGDTRGRSAGGGDASSEETLPPPPERSGVRPLSETIRSRYASKKLCGHVEKHCVKTDGDGGGGGELQMDLMWIETDDAEASYPRSAVLVMTDGRLFFALICHVSDSRLLAVATLSLLVGYTHRFTRLFQAPDVAAATRKRRERLSLIASRLVPHGQLLFMNHRFARHTEKELLAELKLLASDN